MQAQPWRRRSDPTPETLRRLYVEDCRTEKEIAQILGISRAHVAEALDDAGIERRTTRKPCPVGHGTLAKLHADHGTANLARRYGVRYETVQRWLADAGLLQADPEIDHDELRRLYVERRLSLREVAKKLSVPRARLQRELVIAEIEARSNHDRRPRGNRAKLSDARLTRLYVTKKRGVRGIADDLGVSTEYVGKRLKELDLIKKQGSFTPRGSLPREEVMVRAPELYETGLSTSAVAKELGVSASTVLKALHEAQAPVRPPGPHSDEKAGRALIDDLYGDPEIRRVLRRHCVVIPEVWAPMGPFAALVALPLPEKLLRDLYEDVGLSAFQMGLLLGVGKSAVQAALKRAGVEMRSAANAAPWTAKRRA